MVDSQDYNGSSWRRGIPSTKKGVVMVDFIGQVLDWEYYIYQGSPT